MPGLRFPSGIVVLVSCFCCETRFYNCADVLSSGCIASPFNPQNLSLFWICIAVADPVKQHACNLNLRGRRWIACNITNRLSYTVNCTTQ